MRYRYKNNIFETQILHHPYIFKSFLRSLGQFDPRVLNKGFTVGITLLMHNRNMRQRYKASTCEPHIQRSEQVPRSWAFAVMVRRIQGEALATATAHPKQPPHKCVWLFTLVGCSWWQKEEALPRVHSKKNYINTSSTCTNCSNTFVCSSKTCTFEGC